MYARELPTGKPVRREIQNLRTNVCLGLKLLELKQTPIEKYQYLTHLRATNVHLFYRLLSENIKVRFSVSHTWPELETDSDHKRN